MENKQESQQENKGTVSIMPVSLVSIGRKPGGNSTLKLRSHSKWPLRGIRGGKGFSARRAALLRGVLEEAHGTDVVLSDVIAGAAHSRIPQVDGHSIHHQRHNTRQVLDKVAIKDLHAPLCRSITQLMQGR